MTADEMGQPPSPTTEPLGREAYREQWLNEQQQWLDQQTTWPETQDVRG